ncbi:MAG TPA: TonB-dependent receptor [Terracidiphilus sp.]|nr:TonB-dependent receptor [Terracidiphilus sp.]
MYLQLRFLMYVSLGFMLWITATAANGQTAASAPDAITTVTIHGHVSDPSGALIPGAAVTIANKDGVPLKSVKADAAGAYEVRGLPVGSYYVQVSFAGFAPFQSQLIQVAAGQIKRVDVSMAVEVEQQNVVVTDDSPSVNVEAGGNASAVVIKGKDLDALSDDPDELSNELQALAGPSAGPNGGQIYIDGFTGGQLPPKSAIREIRINQNPFSAEFDRLGYGRIEILTKPGTDKLHGQVFVMGNDSAFNTGDPFVRTIPPYNRIQYNATVSGALSKKSSFFLSMEQRDNHDEQVYDFQPAVAGTCDFGFGVYAAGICSGSEPNPHNHITVSPRIDLQLGDKNTLTMRYQFYYDAESGDISNTQLPSQSISSNSIEHTLQLSDSQIINDHIVNETRLEYRRALETDTPVSALPTIKVSGNFTGGGASTQLSNDHQDHLELQNFTTMSVGRHAIKFGAWLRDNRDANTSTSNRNGTLTFSFAGYQDALAKLAAGQNLNAVGSDLVNFTAAAGRTSYVANVFDGALFLQDDIKVNPRFTLSGGIRWEAQNHIADHNDWAPRVALAYALDAKGNKPAKTVLRAGYGIFYDRVQIANVLAATQQSINSGQVQLTATSPACLNGTSLTSVDFSACLPAAPYTATPNSTIVSIAPHFHAPYTHQLGASLERQLTKTTTATVTYLRSFGVHQVVTRDANAFEPLTGTTYYNSSTGPRPNASLGIDDQYFSEAVYKQNQMILNVNARISPKFSVFGFYNLSFANTDGAGGEVSNSYNLSQDYGRAGFVSRHMVFLMGNYTAPWGLRLNPFIVARSGRPYNIVSGLDLTGDNFINDRPGIADSSMCGSGSSQFVTTSYGCLDVTPGPGEKLLGMNLGDSPASVAVNLRVSRGFGLGPKVESSGMHQDGGPGGPGGGRGRGGPGGGLGPGGLSGGGGPPRGMFGGGTGRKYSLTFSAQALNLFNNINYGTPTGTISPSPILDSSGNVSGYDAGANFGKSRGLAGQMFSQGAASRRIFLQAVFSF